MQLDATQKELKADWAEYRLADGLGGCNSERIERYGVVLALRLTLWGDATQKELKARSLSHRVSTRVSERFSWVRLGGLSIGFCDWASCVSLFLG